MINISKGDPTKTIILRKKLVDQFVGRFNIVKKLSNESIVKNDCFGIKKSNVMAKFSDPVDYGAEAIPEKQLAFYPSPVKIDKYYYWLEGTEGRTVFQKTMPRISEDNKPSLWFDMYIAIAYQRGMTWAINNIKRDSSLLKTLNLTREELYNFNVSEAFNLSIHSDAVGVLYSRALTDLKGITAKMNAQIIRELSEGVEAGISMTGISKSIANRIEKIGIHRATLLARTEIVRAHHIASINTYKKYGIYKIKIEAEWSTAGDSRVCELCAPMNGKIYTLDQIMYKIPVHPQCRCAALPHVE